MKTLIAFFIFLLTNQHASAQKNFEGKIVYEFSNDISVKANTEIYFGQQKIKIIETSMFGSQIISATRMIDLKNGIEYHYDDTNRIYCKSPLLPKKNNNSRVYKPFPQKNKRVLGYTCTAYQIPVVAKEILNKNKYMPPLQVCKWYADSLLYRVDRRYWKAEALEKVTNGTNVAMGFQVLNGNESRVEMTVQPVLISPGQIPDSLFLIPVTYKLLPEKKFSQTVVEKFISKSIGKRPPGNVVVASPSSNTIKTNPDSSAIISLEKDGRVFLTIGSKLKKVEILEDINRSKALHLDSTELLKLKEIAVIGMPFAKIKTMLAAPALVAEQMEGIPVRDSTHNELADWIKSITNVYATDDAIKLEDIILIKGDGNARYPDFKNVKYALKKNGVYKFRIVTTNTE